MKKFLSTLALFLAFAGACRAQTQDYIQLTDNGWEAELQIAVESFTKDGITVDLYGVVHMADEEYYDSVQVDLDRYDTVLYEGIKQGTKPNRGTVGLNLLQKGMARILGLEFQKDGIAYIGTNMVHADIDVEALEESLDGQKISPLQKMFSPERIKRLKPIFDAMGPFLEEVIDGLLAQQPELRNQLKLEFAKELAGTDISKALPEKMKKAIIDDRNEIVMGVLAEQLKNPKKKRIAIFYGAGHNPDFAQRLLAKGWTRGQKVWKTAWRISR